ncbi:hypothetical protein [Ornithinibacillus halophilus]|uniref:Uncharacterized protein n=1 Tax=Ornithinibacillus halophilus TaxID=930117 RepID=A0A1M5N0B6_9BACI|nr:hypothetical protein [Ornithinibacillus halophilus]SHG82895.1 hypothetical protein SAMN05216225_106815 [Ornithinibacillus halophilus]
MEDKENYRERKRTSTRNERSKDKQENEIADILKDATTLFTKLADEENINKLKNSSDLEKLKNSGLTDMLQLFKSFKGNKKTIENGEQLSDVIEEMSDRLDDIDTKLSEDNSQSLDTQNEILKDLQKKMNDIEKQLNEQDYSKTLKRMQETMDEIDVKVSRMRGRV